MRQARARSEEEKERSLRIIDREAQRLSRLVDNVLLFSKASRGALRVSLEPRRLAPLIREIVESLAPTAETRQVRVRLDLDGTVDDYVDRNAIRTPR
jgi:signal transduction histidine kinase